VDLLILQAAPQPLDEDILAAGNRGENDDGGRLVDVRLSWVNQMSWSAIGTRPISAKEAVDFS
jgi:hypothetical protein